MARINLDKFRSLRRLYGGLRVLTILAGGLLAILALSMLFYHPGSPRAAATSVVARDRGRRRARAPGLGQRPRR